MTMNKPITIKDLYTLCKAHILQGEGDKVIMISNDDEGNGFHYLWYTFSTPDEAMCEEYLCDIDESIAPKDKTIILG